MGLLAQHQGKSLIPEGGDNRYHAILGADGPAYFVSPSSFAPALIALGARISIFGPKGSRTVDLEKFFRIPKSENEREHALEPSEIVTEIVVPPSGNKKNATYEVRQKLALDWPLAAAAVALEMSGGNVKSARVVLGHVAPTPWVAAADKALAGKPVTEETAAAAGAAAVSGAKALSKNGYKIRLAEVAVKRAVLRAAGKEVA
jgi:xanthine dehydrogenase YagS FAD-binding subunit